MLIPVFLPHERRSSESRNRSWHIHIGHSLVQGLHGVRAIVAAERNPGQVPQAHTCEEVCFGNTGLQVTPAGLVDGPAAAP